MSRLQGFVSAVETALDDGTVGFRVNQVNKGKHGKKRRVHWYGEGGTIEAPAQTSGRNSDGDPSNGVREPDLWDRIEQIQCVIFAEDETTIELLMENLLRVISNTAGDGAVEWNGYEWELDQIDRRIPLIRLRFGLRWPVTEETSQLRPITDVENQCEIVTE